jgi:hypothetical protein
MHPVTGIERDHPWTGTPTAAEVTADNALLSHQTDGPLTADPLPLGRDSAWMRGAPQGAVLVELTIPAGQTYIRCSSGQYYQDPEKKAATARARVSGGSAFDQNIFTEWHAHRRWARRGVLI